jgi:hypothetical protein
MLYKFGIVIFLDRLEDKVGSISRKGHGIGVLCIDYLQNGETITGEYYCNLLTRLDGKKIVKKDSFCKRKKIIFHQENAPAHNNVLAVGKLRDLHYELLEHPLYCTDLAPCDFCLFPKLKHTYSIN